MSIAANKSVIRRYFQDVLDGGQASLVAVLFAPDCVVHRPELPEPLVGREQVTAYVSARPRTYSRSVTSFEHLIAEDDLVAVRLRHEVGKIASSGKSITWTANVFFRVRDEMIVEEWVERDEAGMLQQLGALPGPDHAR
jgi:predicted SnoaL-like aldol condensation-catalyzing enzyme